MSFFMVDAEEGQVVVEFELLVGVLAFNECQLVIQFIP